MCVLVCARLVCVIVISHKIFRESMRSMRQFQSTVSIWIPNAKCSEAFNLLSPSHRRRQWRRRQPENSNKAPSFVVIKTHCIHTYTLNSVFQRLSIREEIQFSIFASLVWRTRATQLHSIVHAFVSMEDWMNEDSKRKKKKKEIEATSNAHKWQWQWADNIIWLQRLARRAFNLNK